MCTVSLIRPLVGTSREWAGGDPLALRLVVNRDELRSRLTALPPVVLTTETGRAIMPIDPQGGGSWVAASDRGLVFALLNGPLPPGSMHGAQCLTRGLVIPALVGCTSVDEAVERAHRLPLERFQPWRLLVADGTRVADLELKPGGRLRHLKSLQPVRVMATSSSVRSGEAHERRTRAFREIVTPVDARTQDAFHRCTFEDDLDLGVLMERTGSRTVSRTVIEVRAAGITMHYEPVATGLRIGERVTARLAREVVSAAGAA